MSQNISQAIHQAIRLITLLSDFGTQDEYAGVIIGSRNYPEISVNSGNAMKYFGVEKGGRIRVLYEKSD